MWPRIACESQSKMYFCTQRLSRVAQLERQKQSSQEQFAICYTLLGTCRTKFSNPYTVINWKYATHTLIVSAKVSVRASQATATAKFSLVNCNNDDGGRRWGGVGDYVSGRHFASASMHIPKNRRYPRHHYTSRSRGRPNAGYYTRPIITYAVCYEHYL